jgi:hypothetical protein
VVIAAIVTAVIFVVTVVIVAAGKTTNPFTGFQIWKSPAS